MQNLMEEPHLQMLRSIELYGTRVAPEVRRAIGGTSEATRAGDTTITQPATH